METKHLQRESFDGSFVLEVTMRDGNLNTDNGIFTYIFSAVLEVTMRDGNDNNVADSFYNSHFRFRSDYEGWKQCRRLSL